MNIVAIKTMKRNSITITWTVVIKFQLNPRIIFNFILTKTKTITTTLLKLMILLRCAETFAMCCTYEIILETINFYEMVLSYFHFVNMWVHVFIQFYVDEKIWSKCLREYIKLNKWLKLLAVYLLNCILEMQIAKTTSN